VNSAEIISSKRRFMTAILPIGLDDLINSHLHNRHKLSLMLFCFHACKTSYIGYNRIFFLTHLAIHLPSIFFLSQFPLYPPVLFPPLPSYQGRDQRAKMQLKSSVEQPVKCAFVKIEKNVFKFFKMNSYLA